MQGKAWAAKIGMVQIWVTHLIQDVIPSDVEESPVYERVVAYEIPRSARNDNVKLLPCYGAL